jgi:hypothetical protein
VAGKAVHHSRKQRKLFIVRESSKSCSSLEKAAKAVHRSRKQRKLFIRTSTSKQWQQWLSTVQDTGNGGSVSCRLQKVIVGGDGS